MNTKATKLTNSKRKKASYTLHWLGHAWQRVARFSSWIKVCVSLTRALLIIPTTHCDIVLGNTRSRSRDPECKTSLQQSDAADAQDRETSFQIWLFVAWPRNFDTAPLWSGWEPTLAFSNPGAFSQAWDVSARYRCSKPAAVRDGDRVSSCKRKSSFLIRAKVPKRWGRCISQRREGGQPWTTRFVKTNYHARSIFHTVLQEVRLAQAQHAS